MKKKVFFYSYGILLLIDFIYSGGISLGSILLNPIFALIIVGIYSIFRK